MINKSSYFLLFFITFFITTGSFAQSYDVEQKILMIEFKKIPSGNDLHKVENLPYVTELKRFDDFDSQYFKKLYRAKIEDKNSNINENKLKSNTLIRKVERVYEIEALSLIPSDNARLTTDTFVNYQWGLDNSGQVLLKDIDDINLEKIPGRKGADIGVKKIHSKLGTLMKKEIKVALLDSGIDIEHFDLADSILKNEQECTASGGLPFNPREDKDGNGYVGDCMGWNFTGRDEGDNRPTDRTGHGTHLAGILAAKISNSNGVSGVSSKIKLLPVKILKKREKLNNSSALSSFTDRVTKGILYAVKMNVDVINLSLGWPKALDTSYVRNAIIEAENAGIIIVAAAGNNNSYKAIFPCAYGNVICAGATTIDGSYASFSNYGGVVDLMAPGEQILSTYPSTMEPKMFSTLGFEIKNGTSQAAPFVSAAVSVLKGVYPEISKDELIARLYESSLKVEGDKYSIAGLIQIEKAIKIEPTSSVRPVFKNLQTISFDLLKKDFAFELPIKNYWSAANNIEVSVELSNSSVSMGNDLIKIATINKGETATLKFTGTILNTGGDSESLLNVFIKVDGKKSKTFTHNITFVREISNQDPDVKSLDLKYQGENTDLIVVSNNKVLSKLRTVYDKYRTYSSPEYYLQVVEANEGAKLTILSLKDGSYEALKSIVIPDAKKILSVVKMDLNYDGKIDYLVRSYAVIDGKKFIKYSYLSSNMDALFSKAHFNFYPETVLIHNDWGKVNFVPLSSPQGKIAVPIFIGQGTIPKKDKNPDVWEEEDLNKKNHIYYLGPDFDSGEMVTKIIDNYKFLEKTREDLNLYWSDTVEVLSVAFQSKQSLEQGIGSFIISTGGEFHRSYFLVEVVKDAKYSINRMYLPDMDLEGRLSIPVTVIDKSKVDYYGSTAFTGLQTDTLAHYLVLDEKNLARYKRQYRYEHARKQDHILGIISSFVKNDKSYSFFQTKGNIVLKIQGDQESKVYTHPINRVSFLPGNVFNELFYPVTKGEGENALPSFYIDATSIYSGHVYVLTATEDGMFSPLINNILVPDNCSSMNPVRFDKTEAFTLLCLEGEKVKIIHIPFN